VIQDDANTINRLILGDVHADFYLNWRYLIQGDPIILIGRFCYFLQRVAPTCQMWWCQIIHDRRFRVTPIQLIGWFWAIVHADFYLNWRYLIQGDPIILIGWFCWFLQRVAPTCQMWWCQIIH